MSEKPEKSENKPSTHSILSISSYGAVSLVLVRVHAGERSRVVVQLQKTCAPGENPTHFGPEDLPALAMLCSQVAEQLITVHEPGER